MNRREFITYRRSFGLRVARRGGLIAYGIDRADLFPRAGGKLLRRPAETVRAVFREVPETRIVSMNPENTLGAVCRQPIKSSPCRFGLG
jgi:hypothetical protein